jgi:hypothetical protein
VKRSFRFFVAGSDLSEGIARAESGEALLYVRSGYYDDEPIPIYKSACDIPGIDTTPSEASSFCPLYLALPTGTEVRVETIQMVKGGVNYKIAYGEHPEGFLIHFGGMFEDAKLMAGSCFAYSEDADAFTRCNSFFEQLTLGFVAVRDSRRLAYRVGSKAFELLKSGFPLQTNLSDWEIITPDAIPKRLRNK